MAVKSYKPTSPGLRQRTTSSFAEITASRPEKSLTKGKMQTGGRDNRGHLTSWWRGGGHKRSYRQIDFRRDKTGIPATWPWGYHDFANAMAKPVAEEFAFAA